MGAGKLQGAAEKTAGQAIRAADRAGEAVRLRLAGADFKAIAEQLGYQSAASAYKAVRRGIEALKAPKEARELRDEQRLRLGRLLLAWYPRALEDEKAAAMVLRLLERMAKLDGLDAPVKVARTDSQGRDLAVRREAFIGVLSQLPEEELRVLAGLREECKAQVGGDATLEIEDDRRDSA